MKVLVTGATGCLGSALVEDLLKKKQDVRVLVRDKDKVGNAVEIVEGNILDRKAVKSAAKDCDVVYHLAGIVDYSLPYERLYAINYLGTKNILEVSNCRFVFCSSVGVFGELKKLPADETHPCNPANAYAKTKYLAEQLVLKKEDTTVVRPAPIYGPRSGQFVDLLRKIYNGKLSYIGSGNYRNHMANVHNVVEGLTLAAKKKVEGETFILADNEIKTGREIYSMLVRLLETEPRKPIPYWTAYLYALYSELTGSKMNRTYLRVLTQDRAYSIEKAKKILGYRARVGIEKGMEEMVRWWKENHL